MFLFVLGVEIRAGFLLSFLRVFGVFLGVFLNIKRLEIHSCIFKFVVANFDSINLSNTVFEMSTSFKYLDIPGELLYIGDFERSF